LCDTSYRKKVGIVARGKRQEARGKRQEARGKRQKAKGKRQEAKEAARGKSMPEYDLDHLPIPAWERKSREVRSVLSSAPHCFF
jgi:uncharacterized protein YjbJ (UPF0337 family)